SALRATPGQPAPCVWSSNGSQPDRPSSGRAAGIGSGSPWSGAARAGGCRVKFSMIFEAQVELGTPATERRAIRDCVEQAVYAEQVGFDGIWAVEHHALV